MPESFREYKDRILGYVEGKRPLRVQAATPEKLAKRIHRVPRARLRKRPAPGKWSVGEILAHLADSELLAGYRIRKILEAPGTPIQAIDQNRWAEVGKYARRDPRASLALFRDLRRMNLSLLRSLTPAQWNQAGVHAERGEESIETIARLVAGHDLNHLGQVEAILSRKK